MVRKPKKKKVVVKLTPKEQGLLKECKSILKENPKLKRKKLDKIKDLEKRLYYLKVWYITESQPLHELRNHKKRGWRKYHLDHVVPIVHGFLNNMPPEQIGHISNLRFIHWSKNMKKGSSITEDSHRVLRKIKRSNG